MAGSPTWKVYDASGTYQAACKDLGAAAALAAFYSTGATIRHNHRLIVWREGAEVVPAGESYDRVEELIWARIRQARAAKAGRPYNV